MNVFNEIPRLRASAASQAYAYGKLSIPERKETGLRLRKEAKADII